MSKRSNVTRTVVPRDTNLSDVGRALTGRAWLMLRGLSRLFTPAARGVYHPQASSPVILGVGLPRDSDLDAIGRELWWRGLGLIERDGQIIAGADITAAVEQRRVRQARVFVTRQLRDAGVRGALRRWE